MSIEPPSTQPSPTETAGPNADHRFVGYYAAQSEDEATHQRIDGVRGVVLRLRQRRGLATEALDVLDIGCGPGAQVLAWAQGGHRVTGVDISAPLIELGRQRAAQGKLAASFHVGSATALPVANAAFDVVMVSELLEHVQDWQACLDEALRVLRPGGVLYCSTTNWLCPVQEEFRLPLYSWYPAALKRRCEKMAVTTHRHWVQFASFPAVHWFSFYQFRRYLNARGIAAYDRFDVMDDGSGPAQRAVVHALRGVAALRFIGHLLTPYTVVVGLRPATTR